jgi:hypothetical protein
MSCEENRSKNITGVAVEKEKEKAEMVLTRPKP